MKKGMLLAGLVAAVTVASAQKPDTKRINQIWGAANDRLSRQADAWFEDGDFPRVVQLLRMHNQVEPSNIEIATNLGWMLENVELREEALAVYIALRRQNPNDPDAAFPEANFYFMKKVYAKVPPILEPTMKGRPHANNYRILAHAYERMKMLADSKRIWELYISIDPNDEAAKANLSRVAKKLGGSGR